jgi:hypothetical protein
MEVGQVGQFRVVLRAELRTSYGSTAGSPGAVRSLLEELVQFCGEFRRELELRVDRMSDDSTVFWGGV